MSAASPASGGRVTGCACSSSATACCGGSTHAASDGRDGEATGTCTSCDKTATSTSERIMGSASDAARCCSRSPSLARHYPPVPSVVARPHRSCNRCGTTHPDSFRNVQAQLCMDCWLLHIEDSWCRQCGRLLPLSRGSEPRHCCQSNACQRSLIRSTRPYANRGNYATGPKRCPRCEQVFPRTTEYWYVSKKATADRPAALDGYCKMCRKAATRRIYQTSDRYRQQTLDRAARQRERIRQRRAEDPDFDRLHRQRLAAWGREQRRFRRERPTDTVVPSGGTAADLVDARPVSAAMLVYAMARGQKIEAVFGEGLGRARRRWMVENMRASAAVVDRALIAMDALWWDIFDPEGDYQSVMSAYEWPDAVDAASWAFEGERLLG